MICSLIPKFLLKSKICVNYSSVRFSASGEAGVTVAGIATDTDELWVLTDARHTYMNHIYMNILMPERI